MRTGGTRLRRGPRCRRVCRLLGVGMRRGGASGPGRAVNRGQWLHACHLMGRESHGFLVYRKSDVSGVSTWDMFRQH